MLLSIAHVQPVKEAKKKEAAMSLMAAQIPTIYSAPLIMSVIFYKFRKLVQKKKTKRKDNLRKCFHYYLFNFFLPLDRFFLRQRDEQKQTCLFN